MAYNLRSRTIREELLDDEEEEVNQQSDEEVDNGNNDSGSDYSTSAVESDSDGDIDMENASLNARLNESRARGRPTSKLYGKDKFVWDTRVPTRTSGMCM